MRLFMLTSIGFCANTALDQKKTAPFSFDDLYAAAEEARLVDLFRRTIDTIGVIEAWAKRTEDSRAVEEALDGAAEALKGRELRKVGVGDNPLCMVIAIVLEAIQQNY